MPANTIVIHILTLGVAYEGTAIPLFWNLPNKAGNSIAQEHEHCIKWSVTLFGKNCIQGVLGDRESASGSLFTPCRDSFLNHT